MSRRKEQRAPKVRSQKKTMANAKTADADLFKLHDKFCAAYQKMKRFDIPGSSAGSLPKATKQEKALHRKWEGAANVAFEKARAVISAPAVTLEGMLMKLHVAGFCITDTKRGTFSSPYYSGIRLWEPGKFVEGDEIAIIVSLRDDLYRFSGRRA